jgi:N-methylhydantoinase A
MTSKLLPLRIGADVGGTFTDVILLDATGRLWAHKVPSTPPDFEQAVLAAIAHLLRQSQATGDQVATVAHGTTVATNAVLEHRGAHTALITTKGFRDVLELRRIRAPQMYDLFFEKPPVLVERYLRLEANERLSASGGVLTPLDEAELWRLKGRLEAEHVEAVAVCLLHGYAFPQHEARLGAFLRQQMPHLHVSLGSEVLRERDEYERTATTVVNAYVQPIMQRYLQAMHTGLQAIGVAAPLLIMQSAGGLTPAEDAAQRPVFALESGPAAGVLAASFLAERLRLANLITFDMGGTTAKASLIEGGNLAYSSEYEVGAGLSAGNRLVGGGGELIRAPSIDIAEVGAGGGSIAYLDRAGGLRVGPRSAGAMPGPACYGRGGGEPTVTDANVVLGYIRPGQLADGEVTINLETAQRAIYDHIAAPLGLTLLQAAEGIHRIANARTMRALRAVSTERGRDPRDFTMLAFGGSGPIHAAGLAQELHLQQVIVPPLPGLFSALGLLFSGVEYHDSRSCLLAGSAVNAVALQAIRTEMEQAMQARFASEGFADQQMRFSCAVDVRYWGQASKVRIAVGEARFTDEGVRQVQERFAEEHERLYGHRAAPDNPLEITAVRLVGRAGERGYTGLLQPAERTGASQTSRRAYFGPEVGLMDTPVVARRALVDVVRGPLLIDEYDSTTVVPPAAQVYRDDQGNLILTR